MRLKPGQRRVGIEEALRLAPPVKAELPDSTRGNALKSQERVGIDTAVAQGVTAHLLADCDQFRSLPNGRRRRHTPARPPQPPNQRLRSVPRMTTSTHIFCGSRASNRRFAEPQVRGFEISKKKQICAKLPRATHATRLTHRSSARRQLRLAPLGPTVRRVPLPLSWQAGRMQFGSDRGRPQHGKLETLQGPSSPGADHGI